MATTPGDLQAVLDATVASALRLLDIDVAIISQPRGDLLGWTAYGIADRVPRDRFDQITDALANGRPVPMDRSSVRGRAYVERRTIEHVADEITIPEHSPEYDRALLFGLHANLCTPLLSKNSPVPGVMNVLRLRPEPFTDRQIALLRDLRRPGRHRHRERPPVRGASGA